MPRFRKLPVEVEAVQWFKEGDHPAVENYSHSDGYQGNDWFPVVSTLEGRMRVTPGDWIVTGVLGEVYPVKPEIFAQTYEAA